MLKAFDFETDGRTFSCRVEAPSSARTESWWWFCVTGDASRYAPFQAKTGDTQESVQTRIATFYADLLYKRSQPAQPRAHWAHRNKNPAGQEGGASAG